MPIKEENPIPKKKEEKPPKSAPMNLGANEKPVFI